MEKILTLIELILKHKEPFIIGGIIVIDIMSIIYIPDFDKLVTILSTSIGALAGMAGVQLGRNMTRASDNNKPNETGKNFVGGQNDRV